MATKWVNIRCVQSEKNRQLNIKGRKNMVIFIGEKNIKIGISKEKKNVIKKISSMLGLMFYCR